MRPLARITGAYEEDNNNKSGQKDPRHGTNLFLIWFYCQIIHHFLLVKCSSTSKNSFTSGFVALFCAQNSPFSKNILALFPCSGDPKCPAPPFIWIVLIRTGDSVCYSALDELCVYVSVIMWLVRIIFLEAVDQLLIQNRIGTIDTYGYLLCVYFWLFY